MSNYSVADEIKKYKDLLDQGVISEEEFNKKKEELLSSAPQVSSSSNAAMSAHATGILAYITWIGFIIAIAIGDREGAKFHLNQALVLNLFALLSVIPVVGWIWGIVVFVFWIIGLVGACQDVERPVPLLGGIKIL